jgi:hypothetical protein
LAARKAWEEGKAQYPTPPALTVGPAELLELSEAAQARADLVKAIAAETAAIEDEYNAAGYDEHCAWHEGWRGPWKPNPWGNLKPIDLNRHKRTESIILGCMIAALMALICLVVHFAQKAGLPW